MIKIIFGILVPAGIFLFSFLLTYALYKHFSQKVDKKNNNKN